MIATNKKINASSVFLRMTYIFPAHDLEEDALAPREVAVEHLLDRVADPVG